MIAPEYYSSQEETDVETTFEKTVHESHKKTRKIPIWEIIQTFKCAGEAEKSIGKEWSKCTKYDTDEGSKVPYRCNRINLHSGWFEGAHLFVPSTNNALEATNRVIKDQKTFRNRLPLSQFLQLAIDIVYGWSFDRDPSNINYKKFILEPSISFNLWTNSYQWAKESKEIKILDDKF